MRAYDAGLMSKKKKAGKWTAGVRKSRKGSIENWGISRVVRPHRGDLCIPRANSETEIERKTQAQCD